MSRCLDSRALRLNTEVWKGWRMMGADKWDIFTVMPKLRRLWPWFNPEHAIRLIRHPRTCQVSIYLVQGFERYDGYDGKVA